MKSIESLYKYRNKWAIVAGAAKGIGKHFAIRLAEHEVYLVLVDHDEKKLKELEEELSAFKIKTKSILINLNDEDSAEKIMSSVLGLDLCLLIYVAAFSRVKSFMKLNHSELDSFLNINTRTMLHLVHSFSNLLIENKKPGGIILLSSLAGLIGMQKVAVYAATKAFTWNLAEGLHHELKEHQIDVFGCIVGATSTETYLETKPEYGSIKPQIQEPSEVAEYALRKLGSHAISISGFNNKFNYFLLTRILPRKIAARIANKVIDKMYRKSN